MRHFFILLLLFGVLNATQTKQKLTLGAGPYIFTQPYKDATPLVVPSPVIFFDNSLFYVRWSRAGVYFLGEKQEEYAWGFSLTVQPRPNGYDSSDSDFLEGMQERERTIEGGVAFSATYGDAYLEIMLLTDLLNRYDSWIIRTEIGEEYKLGDFTLYPSLVLIYESNKFTNYYYGVQASEVDLNKGRHFYEAKGGLLLGAQTYINYKINNDLAILANIRADKISSSAASSPLTDEEFIISGLVSLIYKFEY